MKYYVFLRLGHGVNMKWFQMRIMHRILGTNVILKHMGITPNENCSFCAGERDCLEHIFGRCNVSRSFWDGFVGLVNVRCQNAVNFRLSETLVILGIDKTIKIDCVFAFILVLAKQYLYKCKLDKNVPNIHVFRRKLLSRYDVEKYNAVLNFSYNEFAAKWQPYIPLFH